MVGIIPAAGRSRRMGRDKLLLPVGGTPLLARVTDALLGGELAEVRVVIPPVAPELRKALAGRPVRFVINPAAGGRMLDSVRCGLRELPAACRWVLVAPADLPGLSGELVRQVATAAASAPPERSLVVPVHSGRRGHPIGFAASHVAELLAGHDDAGLRGLLQTHSEAVLEVPVGSAAAFADVDTPEDYRRLASGAGRAEHPALRGRHRRRRGRL